MARKRTRKGNVTAKTRRKHGMGKKGKYPVFDQRSAMSALKLRGHGKGTSKKKVLNKVSRWAGKTGNKRVKTAVARARKRDSRK